MRLESCWETAGITRPGGMWKAGWLMIVLNSGCRSISDMRMVRKRFLEAGMAGNTKMGRLPTIIYIMEKSMMQSGNRQAGLRPVLMIQSGIRHWRYPAYQVL